MKEFCNINEKFESVKTKIFQCVTGYEAKRELINVQIDKLKKYAETLKENDDKYIILDTIHLLAQERDDIDQIIQAVSNISNELKSLSTLKILEKNIESEKADGIRILEAQEQVRKKIASDLHDSTVQNLTGLTYKTELCTKLLEKDPTRVRLELQVMLSSLKSIIEDMRHTIYNLRPMLVGNKSLDSCIKKFLENMGILYPYINFKYDVTGNYRKVKETYGLTLIRIIQEACQNAAKHSKAQCIKVKVEYSVNRLILQVEDNGIGFEQCELWNKNDGVEHFGLAIMKERAQLMNANLVIKSSKNEGTIVCVEIPEVYSDEGDNNGSD